MNYFCFSNYYYYCCLLKYIAYMRMYRFKSSYKYMRVFGISNSKLTFQFVERE